MDGYIVRIYHDGDKIWSQLQMDYQYPGADVWRAGDIEMVGNVSGRSVATKVRLIYKKDAVACNLSKRASMHLTVNPGGDRMSGAYVDGVVNPRTCSWSPRPDREISYKRLVFENFDSDQSHLQPKDTFAADCTPGQHLPRDSAAHKRVLAGLEEVKRFPPPRVYDPSDRNQYLVFVVTDGTGNHGDQFVSQPKATDDLKAYAYGEGKYPVDKCMGKMNQVERARGLLYTQYPSNSRLLYNHVVIAGGGSPRIIPIYVRGVGTAPYDAHIARRFVQSGAPGVTIYDFNRVVNDAFAQLSKEINRVYASNPRARFVFVTSGFSRGAAAARVLHMKLIAEGVRNAGAAKRYVIAPGDANIVASVLYDTVASIDTVGGLTDLYKGDVMMKIPYGTHTLHVVAENEYRTFFPLTPASGPTVREIWMPGAHSDIGGTYTTDGISAVTLQMGLHFLHAAGVPVGDPRTNFDLKESYLPNPDRFAIHDSRFMTMGVPFEKLVNESTRVIDRTHGASNPN